MARPTPKEILELKPHIVEHVYDESGKEVDDILKELGRIWGESCARKAREKQLASKP